MDNNIYFGTFLSLFGMVNVRRIRLIPRDDKQTLDCSFIHIPSTVFQNGTGITLMNKTQAQTGDVHFFKRVLTVLYFKD